MFGPDFFHTSQPQQASNNRLSWQDYINRIQNGPAPSYTAGSGGSGTSAGVSGGSGPLGMGGGASTIPATPVNYGAMHSILNSGVLRGGHASADAPAQQPSAPAPTQQSGPVIPPWMSWDPWKMHSAGEIGAQGLAIRDWFQNHPSSNNSQPAAAAPQQTGTPPAPPQQQTPFRAFMTNLLAGQK